MNTDTAAKRSKNTKRTKWLAVLGSLILLYTLLGFFVVPAIVKSQMLQRLPALTKRRVSIERVKFNPYVLSLTIDGFSLQETNGDVFSSFGELYVNFQLSSIFKRSWVFDEIRLQEPFAQITYLKDGTFNFANLLNNPPSTPAPVPPIPQPPPPILVYHLRVTNGAVAFADLTRKTPFKIRYQPINVNLTDFTTRRNQTSPYEIFATDDSGESFGWSGNITVDPLRSTGIFRLGGLKLNKYKPYSQDYALFEIVDGQVDVTTDYRYDSATNALDLEVSNLVMTLSRFQLKTPDTGEDVLTIPSLSIKQVSASVARRAAEVGQVQSSGGSVLLRQNQNGTINLLSYLVAPAKAPATNLPPPPGPPWAVKIDEIAFDNYTIKAEDKMPAKPAAFKIDQLGFNLKNVSNASNAPITLALGLRLQDTGSIGVNGALTLLPPWADVFIGVTNLDLRMVQSYVEQQVKIAITRGALNVNGHAHYAAARPGAPLLSFAGDVSLRNLAVTDEMLFNDLAKWDSFDLTGIDATLQPDKFHIDKIRVIGPSTSVIMGPDHRWNILAILPEKKAGAVESNAPPARLPEMTLGEFVFENASLHFADRSLEPNCTFDIQESSGSIKDISSLVQTPSVLEVKGKVDEFSPFSVSGTLNPMPDHLFVDIKTAFTNMGLTAFSPYTEVYVGRPLQKGKLSLALHYQINQKALNASNDIFIDQLTLGAKNGSTNATKLPVKLAIALFKDRNGRIKLDVPVHGRLDNPEFKLWPIIEQIISNLIVKAVTSPFSMLGAMFGGGEQLSFVAFDPGQAVIPAAETNKLNTLAKALYERPGLTLEINGSVDPAKDRDVMVQAKFQRQIKALYVKEMTDAGKPPIAVDDLKLESGDYARLVAQTYSNTFGAYHPADTNQTTNTAAPPPSPKPAPVPNPVVNNSLSSAKPLFAHGASRMVSSWRPNDVVAAPSASPMATSNAVSSALAAIAQTDLAAMEEQLLQKIEITSDEFRQLMQDRAKQVESYLLKSDKVTADRLFITVPKPIEAKAKGEDRVNLTLD